MSRSTVAPLVTIFGCAHAAKINELTECPRRQPRPWIPNDSDWTPPGFAESCKAIMTQTDQTKHLAPVYNPETWAPSFLLKRSPQDGDWLESTGILDRAGQTLQQYVDRRKRVPNKLKNCIYLVCIGDFPGRANLMHQLCELTRRYFQMDVKELAPIPEKGLTSRYHDVGAEHPVKQFKTGPIHDRLEELLPSDGFCLMGVTLTDLYPQDHWNFVFGQARINTGSGIFSFARYFPDFGEEEGESDPTKLEENVYQEFLLRCCKVLTHEIGHLFGIMHCIHFECNMNGSNSIEESDLSPIHLCPVCLRKLDKGINMELKSFDPIKRYQELLEIYKKYGFENEAEWVTTRLKITKRDDPISAEPVILPNTAKDGKDVAKSDPQEQESSSDPPVVQDPTIPITPNAHSKPVQPISWPPAPVQRPDQRYADSDSVTVIPFVIVGIMIGAPLLMFLVLKCVVSKVEVVPKRSFDDLRLSYDNY